MELQKDINSYITLEEVKQIIEDYVYVDAILEYVNTLSDNFINKIINRSTKIIDKLHFKGYKVDSGQPLSFPRYDYKGKNTVVVECPEDIKIGIVLQAIYDSYYLNKDEMQLKQLGVSSYSVDGASISFNNNVSENKYKNGIYKDIYEYYIREYTEYI